MNFYLHLACLLQILVVVVDDGVKTSKSQSIIALGIELGEIEVIIILVGLGFLC